MQFAVITIRERGRRLSRAEIEAAAPIVGDLAIHDIPAEGASARRAVRCAELIDPATAQVRRPLLRPLFDPQIVRVTEHSILLMGHELDPVDGVIHEHVQGWLLRAV